MEDIIKKIYETKSPFNRTDFDRQRVGSATYGETGYDSMVNIISLLEERGYLNKNSVFYDLGSGSGKIVYHVALQCGTKKACGIEYSKEKHKSAIAIGEKYDINEDNVGFVNGSFLEHDLSDATVVYSDNTAFPHHITTAIFEKLPAGCFFVCRSPILPYSKKKKYITEHFEHEVRFATNYGNSKIVIYKKD